MSSVHTQIRSGGAGDGDGSGSCRAVHVLTPLADNDGSCLFPSSCPKWLRDSVSKPQSICAALVVVCSLSLSLFSLSLNFKLVLLS